MAPQSAPAGATLGTGCTARPGVNRAQNATYTFDALGNLIGRGDAPNGQAWETFGYDLLNRLTTRNTNETVASYYADGRLNTRSGVSGTYGYQTGTHRVNSAGGYSLGYDNNGNVTTLTGNGANKTLTYLPFNLPSRIQAEGNTLDYRYDAAHARLKETAQTQTPQGSSSTYYLGAFEEHARNDGVVELRHYLLTPEGAVGIVTRRSDAQDDTRYWFKDHLASIVAITDGAGTARQRFTYDPWGKRSVVPIVNADANAEELGFTGHEHLTEAGLIHMNGRLYFDALGRMLQADPIIQAPYDGQNYDRYAYVFNNPLSFIDPTGYSAWTRIRAPVAAIIVTIMTAGAMTSAALAMGASTTFATVATVAGMQTATLTIQGAMIAGAMGGFAAGGLSSGNIEGALQGALQGAAFGALNFGIGHITTSAGNVFGEYAKAANVALHAVVGCAQSAAAGGSCKGGAASGGFSAAAGAVGLGGGVVGRAVVGAMASKLAGGRAGDGAMVAVIDYLFNCVPHNCWGGEGKRAYSNLPDKLRGAALEFSERIDASGDVSLKAMRNRAVLSFEDRWAEDSLGDPVAADAGKGTVRFFRGALYKQAPLFLVAHEFAHLLPTSDSQYSLAEYLSNPSVPAYETAADRWASRFLNQPIPEDSIYRRRAKQ
ncbi:MAG: hypothetical protein HYZ17_14705 [Betaproteobacteria bacterium]|nr:hypothetical protein [Betaproteobacteria bacterium]